MRASAKPSGGLKPTVASKGDTQVTSGKLLLFSVDRSAAPRMTDRSPWIYLRDTGDRQMISQFKALSAERQAEVRERIAELYEAEQRDEEARRNRAFIDAVASLADEAFSRIWDNPHDAEYDKL